MAETLNLEVWHGNRPFYSLMVWWLRKLHSVLGVLLCSHWSLPQIPKIWAPSSLHPPQCSHPREGDQVKLFMDLKFLIEPHRPDWGKYSCNYKSRGGLSWLGRGFLKLKITRLGFVPLVDGAMMAVSKDDRYELLIRIRHSYVTMVFLFDQGGHQKALWLQNRNNTWQQKFL